MLKITYQAFYRKPREYIGGSHSSYNMSVDGEINDTVIYFILKARRYLHQIICIKMKRKYSHEA